MKAALHTLISRFAQSGTMRQSASVVLMILTAPLISFGIVSLYQPQIEREALANLEEIARLKSAQIENWLHERVGDSELLLADTAFAQEVAEMSSGRASATLQQRKTYFDHLRKIYGYEGACLLSIEATLLLASGDCEPTTPELEQTLRGLKRGVIASSPLYLHSQNAVHLDWIVPIGAADLAQRPLAALILRADAQRFLYPLIKRWPTTSASGESLLVRQQDDKVIYLNELRGQRDTSLKMVRPLTDDALPAAIAVRAADPGTITGVDYRGIKVLAAYRPIAGTDWKLIAKVDRAEILAPLNRLALWVAAIVLAASGLIALTLRTVWRQRRRVAGLIEAARESQLDLERHQSAQRFSSVFHLSPIAGMIARLDDGRITQINQKFKHDFGWSEDELVGRNSLESGLWSDAASRERFITALGHDGHLVDYDAILMTKDGRARNASLSASILEIDGLRSLLVFGMDVTESRASRARLLAAEASLRESLARTLLLLDSMMDAVICMDHAGRVVTWNSHAEAMFGYPVDEAMGRLVAELIVPPAYRERHQRGMEHFVNTGHPNIIGKRLELTGMRADGSEFPIELTIGSLGGDGQFLFSAAVRDITDRKSIEDRLRKLSLAIEQSTSSVAITNIDGTIEYVNDAFVQTTGYLREEAIGQNPRILKSGRTSPETYVELWATLTQGRTWKGELHNKAKDGRTYIESAQITPLREPGGKITHYVAVKEDITERKRLVEELEQHRHHLEHLVNQRTGELETALEHIRASEERFGFALAATNDGVWDWNLTTQEAYCSPAYFHMLGYEPGELGSDISSVWSDLLPAEERDETITRTNEKLAADGGYQTEFRLRAKEGNYRWIASHAKVVERDTNGEPTRVVGTHTDLEMRKQMENELRVAKEAADFANQAKGAFLANMSHEIRTPMNAIVGLIHVLRRSTLAPSQVNHLEKINGAASHLLSIINDILDLSKIESTRVQLEEIDFHLGTLFDNVRSMMADSAQKKGLELTVDCTDVPLWLRGDPTRLRQSLLNFASNAVKFTSRGYVTLRARMIAESDRGIEVRFEVEDSGAGISAENQAKLFTAFEQADASTTRKYGGTGLGLAITRRLAGLMGGDAGVDSELGRGSTFWFTALLHRGQGAMPAAGDAARNTAEYDAETELRQYAGRRILLADDIEVNRELCLELLQGSGILVDQAGDGREAVDKAATTEYAAILMDMQMPVMDGLEATRTILKLPGRAKPAVIAMTANAFDEDRRICEQAGMVDFLTKPIDPEQLYRVLSLWLAKSAAPVSAAPDPAAPMPHAVPVEVPAEHVDSTDDSLPGLDLKQGLITWGGKVEPYRRFLAKFAETYADSAGKVRLAVEANDLAAAAALGHKLKGAAANLALTDVARCAGEIEQAFKIVGAGNTAPQSVADVLLPLKQAMETALASIVRYTTANDDAEAHAATPSPTDPDAPQRMLAALLQALDTDNPDLAEPIMQQLGTLLPAARLSSIRALIDDFDFRSAEAAARQLAESLRTSNGN